MNALDVELYHPARLSRSNAKYGPPSRLCARNHEFISKNILKCRGTTFYSSSTFIRVPLVKQSTRIDTTAYRVLCTKIKGSAMRNYYLYSTGRVKVIYMRVSTFAPPSAHTHVLESSMCGVTKRLFWNNFFSYICRCYGRRFYIFSSRVCSW